MKRKKNLLTKLTDSEDYQKKLKMSILVAKEVTKVEMMKEMKIIQNLNFKQTSLSNRMVIQESIKLVKKELKHHTLFLYFNLYGGQELITYAKMAYGNQFI